MSDSFEIASTFQLSFTDSNGKQQSWSLADVIANTRRRNKNSFRFDSKFISALKGKHRNFNVDGELISFYPTSHIAVRIDVPSCQITKVLIGSNNDYHPSVSKLIHAHIHVAEDHSPSLCPTPKCTNGKVFSVQCPPPPPGGANTCPCYACFHNHGYKCKKMGSACWATGSHGLSVATKVTCTSTVCSYGSRNQHNQCGTPACSSLSTTCPFFVNPCNHVTVSYIPPKKAMSLASTLGTTYSIGFSVLGGLVGYWGGPAGAKLAFTLLQNIAKGTAFGAKIAAHNKASNPLSGLEKQINQDFVNIKTCMNIKLSSIPGNNLIGEIGTLQTDVVNLGNAKTLADEFSYLHTMFTECDVFMRGTIHSVWTNSAAPSHLYLALQPVLAALQGCSSIYATYIHVLGGQPAKIRATALEHITVLRTAMMDFSIVSHNLAVYAMNAGYKIWNVRCEKSHPKVRTQYHVLLDALRKSTLDPLFIITSGGMGGQVYSGFIGHYANYPLSINVDPAPITRASPKGFPGCVHYCLEDTNCTAIELLNMNTCKLYRSGSVDLTKIRMGMANYQMNAPLQTALIDRTMPIAQIRFLVWNNWGHGMNIPVAFWLNFQPSGWMPLYNRLQLKTEAQCTHLCATTTGCIVSSFYETWCDNLGFYSLRRMHLPPRNAWSPMYMGAHVIFKNARVTRMDKMYWNAPVGSYQKVTVMWEYACLAACAYTQGCIAVDYSTRWTGECRLFHSSHYPILQNRTVTYNPAFRHYHVYSRLTRLYPAYTLPQGGSLSQLPTHVIV